MIFPQAEEGRRKGRRERDKHRDRDTETGKKQYLKRQWLRIFTAVERDESSVLRFPTNFLQDQFHI